MTVVAFDAYYAAAKFARGLLAQGHHLVTRVRTTAVAYFQATLRPGKRRGRRALYGHKTKLRDLVPSPKSLAIKAPSPVYGEAGVTLRYYTYDLLWRRVGPAWSGLSGSSHPTRGQLVLLCTGFDPCRPWTSSAFMAGGSKSKSVSSRPFDTVGAYAYHFWMENMKPIRRGDGSQHPHRQSESYRQALRHQAPGPMSACTRLGLIAQGLLQYLAVTFRRAVWFNFHSYTSARPRPKKRLSRWVVLARPAPLLAAISRGFPR